MLRFRDLDSALALELESVGAGFAPSSEADSASLVHLKRAELVEAFAIDLDRRCRPADSENVEPPRTGEHG